MAPHGSRAPGHSEVGRCTEVQPERGYQMKFLKFAVAAVFAATFSNAYAFHSGGVAECEGCHSMHNSCEGTSNVTGRTFSQGSGPYLLKASDQSGACLNCHQAADTG